MQTKAAMLAAMLKDKKIFYVNIEEPDGEGSTVETVIEDPNGVSCFVEGKIITFNGGGKTASFMVLENAQIIANRTGECDVISTFAGNGGLQIKGKTQNNN
jgi:hypothetical protein